MGDQLPKRNLPLEAEPWGRAIADRLLALERESELSSQNSGLANRGQNSTMNQLAEQIADIQASVDAANDAIAAANLALAGQVAPSTNGDVGSGFTLTTSDQVLASAPFAVPAGYTRAVVTAMGSVVGSTAAGGGDRLFAKVGINGIFGADMATVLASTITWGGVACYGALVLTGLSGGSFNVDVRARLQTGPGSNFIDYAQVAATVLFLK